MNLYTGEKGDQYYHMRQLRRSEFVQIRRAGHFQKYIKETDTVLDFGCGTGGILKHLNCEKKIGIEVNAPSIKEAKKNNIDVHPSFKNITDESIDIVISNHSMEHVETPAEHIKEMKRVLKKNGRLILVVPAESPFRRAFKKWCQNDPDHHIYSWTPLSFGNLIHQCGFEIEKSIYRPIGYTHATKFLAEIHEGLFQLSRYIVAFLMRRYEVVCFAHKK